MTDNFIRHLIAFLVVLICLIIFSVGYMSGIRGWWFTGFTLLFVYIIVYKLVDV